MKKTLFTAALLALITCILAISAYATVAEAEYTETPPNMTADVVDESWGEPAVHVDGSSPNSELHVYRSGLTPEDGFDLYARWDNDYMYLCFVSPDDDPCGAVQYWKGDGYMIAMLPGEDVHYSEDPADAVFTYTWSLGLDGKSITMFGAANSYDPTIAFKDGMMIAKIRISLRDMGFRRNEDKTNAKFAIRMVRLSARKNEGGLSGWLAWGKFYEKDILPTETDTKAEGSNHIVFVKSAAVTEEMPVVPDEPSDAADIPEEQPSDYAKAEVAAAIDCGLVPENLRKDYTAPVTRGAVAKMFVNLLEKASGKTIDEIIAEKGVSINENAFADTTDKAILAANALGILKGTGGGNFSPDGTLKRGQIAAIINRVAVVMGTDTSGYSHSFTDLTDNYSWVSAELGWPVHAGVIKGVGGERFNPGGELSTQDAILITYRALNALKK